MHTRYAQMKLMKQKQSDRQEIDVKGSDVMGKLTALVQKGGGSHIFEEYQGRMIVEIPLSLGILLALLSPHVAAIKLIEYVERHTGLDKLADPLQHGLFRFFGRSGKISGPGLRMLDEKGLRHSLHPVVSDVPLSAWTGTMLLDALWFLKKDEGVTHVADLTLVTGLLASAGVAVTGVADWSKMDGAARRVGLLHGLLSGGIMLINLASWVLRLSRKRRAGVAFSTAGYLASLFSAYLGGELIFIVNRRNK